ncbi:hypothetical protein ATANTOWER_011685, partial [Ataeniobius toweri]|nr:hypothetical protein [Ataeniobius toweri]
PNFRCLCSAVDAAVRIFFLHEVTAWLRWLRLRHSWVIELFGHVRHMFRGVKESCCDMFLHSHPYVFPKSSFLIQVGVRLINI